MPDYRKRLLNEGKSSPPLEPLRGRKLMRRDRASAIHATGDCVLSHGRRVLASCGLHGGRNWHVSDAAVSGWSHPDSTAERVCVRSPAFTLTPGHFVRVTLIANPSGMTTVMIPGAGYAGAGVKGQVKIEVTYVKGATTKVVSHTISIPESSLPNGAQPTGSGAAWSAIYRRSRKFFPADVINYVGNLAAWVDGVTASVTISYIGSPRVLDVVVAEEPLALGYDVATTDWIAPMHATGDGGNLGQLTGPVPVIRRNATDASGGAEIVMDAAAWVGQETGPVLMFASAWDEGNQNFQSTETDFKSITGTAYKELVGGVAASYSALRAGWSASSGANARRVQDSEATSVMRDKSNVVPVTCYIYGAMSTATSSPTATVRFETANHSVAEVAIPVGTGYAWRSATGHLRCGLGAQDPVLLQVRAKCSTASGSPAFRWRYIVVAYTPL